MEPPGLLSEGLWPSSSRGGCSPDATAPAVSPHLFLQPPPRGTGPTQDTASSAPPAARATPTLPSEPAGALSLQCSAHCDGQF